MLKVQGRPLPDASKTADGLEVSTGADSASRFLFWEFLALLIVL
jgi:hypothetical protein